MKKLMLSVALIAALYSCKKETVVTPSHYLGEQLNGGIVVYVDQCDHGLISSGVDISGGCPFSLNHLNLLQTNTGYGSGGSNTANIIDRQGQNGYYAADWGAFFGWSLPSKDELDLIYKNKKSLLFTPNKWTTVYWSSSTDKTDNRIWVEDLTTGKQYTIVQDNTTAAVRGVKYF